MSSWSSPGPRSAPARPVHEDGCPRPQPQWHQSEGWSGAGNETKIGIRGPPLPFSGWEWPKGDMLLLWVRDCEAPEKLWNKTHGAPVPADPCTPQVTLPRGARDASFSPWSFVLSGPVPSALLQVPGTEGRRNPTSSSCTRGHLVGRKQGMSWGASESGLQGG